MKTIPKRDDGLLGWFNDKTTQVETSIAERKAKNEFPELITDEKTEKQGMKGWQKVLLFIGIAVVIRVIHVLLTL